MRNIKCFQQSPFGLVLFIFYNIHLVLPTTKDQEVKTPLLLGCFKQFLRITHFRLKDSKKQFSRNEPHSRYLLKIPAKSCTMLYNQKHIYTFEIHKQILKPLDLRSSARNVYIYLKRINTVQGA